MDLVWQQRQPTEAVQQIFLLKMCFFQFFNLIITFFKFKRLFSIFNFYNSICSIQIYGTKQNFLNIQVFWIQEEPWHIFEKKLQ